MKILMNKNEYFEPFVQEDGSAKSSNSTQTNLEITKCIPVAKRRKIIDKLIKDADLEQDELFCALFEVLSGLAKYQEV